MAERRQPHGPSHRFLPQESAAESSYRAQHSENQTQGPVLHNCRIDNFYNITGDGSPRLPSPMWLRDTLRRLRPGRHRDDPHLGYPIIPVARSPSPHERRPVRAARSQIPRPIFATGRSRRVVYFEAGSMVVSPLDSDSEFSSSSSSSSGSDIGVRNDEALGQEADYRKSYGELMRRLSIDSYEARRERDRALRNVTRSRRFRDRWDSGSSTEVEGTVQVCRF
jgi:hypothetical protein